MFWKGQRVHVLASYFDAPNTENEWSKSIFGVNWEVEKCFGTIVSVNKSFGSIKWDIDGNTTKVRLADIKLHEHEANYCAVQPVLHNIQEENRPSASNGLAAAAAAGRHPKMTDSLSKVADVDIDGNGTFKYILIRVYGPDKGGNEEPASKLIVRGYQRASYHVDIYEEVQAKQLKPLGLECECEGGGRIKHDRDERRLLVYGYSQGFGRAQHQLAVDLLKVTYPDYEVTWTNDGY